MGYHVMAFSGRFTVNQKLQKVAFMMKMFLQPGVLNAFGLVFLVWTKLAFLFKVNHLYCLNDSAKVLFRI